MRGRAARWAGAPAEVDRAPRGERRVEPGFVKLFVGAGRQANIRPGDLVGAITGEAEVDADTLGAIQISDRFSLVDVRADVADHVVAAMRLAMLKGRRVTIRRERQESA